MNPGIVNKKTAYILTIFAIILAVVAILLAPYVSITITVLLLGLVLALLIIAWYIYFTSESAKEPAPKPVEKHADVHVPKVETPKPAEKKAEVYAPKVETPKPAEKKAEVYVPKVETPKPAEKHAEAYVPDVEKPAARLSKLPVETIEGIGPKYGKLLRDAGYLTVADLLRAEPARVAEICSVKTKKAERWVAMSRFAALDTVSEEDAEAIVISSDITDLKGLAGADAENLLGKIRNALDRGSFKVPAGYTFDIAKVRSWIEEAKKKS